MAGFRDHCRTFINRFILDAAAAAAASSFASNQHLENLNAGHARDAG